MGPSAATEPGVRQSGTLQGYLSVLRRRWRILVAAVVLVPLAAGIASSRQHARYEAKSQVLLIRGSVANTLTGASDPSNAQTDDQIAQTQASVARAPVIVRRALDAVGLQDRSTQSLLSDSEVTPKAGTLVLEFTVNDRDPKLAVRIAAAYAREYVRYRVELSTDAIRKSLSDVRAQIAQLRGQPGSSKAVADLEERAQQLETLQVLQTANATVLRVPASARQTQPDEVRNVILGLLIGIVFGLGAAALREALDTRVHSESVLLDALDVPLLGRIPPPDPDYRAHRGVQSVADPKGLYAEAFAIARTSLQLTVVDTEPKVIALTSAVAGEGKSTCSANLAAEFARGGREVLLIDLDLRRPTQARLFGAPGGPGVTDVALGSATLTESAKQVELDMDDSSGGLWVLTTGPLPPRPTDFVASGAFTRLLDRARSQFELVILDTPPLLPVGDVPSLSPAVDGLIVVANLRVLRRHDLREMQRVLSTCRAPVLGCLLTGEAEHGKYGYRYAYGYPTASESAADLDKALPGP